MGHEEEPFQLTEEKVPETISPQPWAGLQPHHLPHQTLTQLILNSIVRSPLEYKLQKIFTERWEATKMRDRGAGTN